MTDFIKVTTFFGIFAIMFISALIFNRCESTNNIKDLEKSIIYKDEKIIDCKNKISDLTIKNDSLQNIIDSLNTENFILNFKLLRIKEYNTVAAKGNNIKYLRGWINRVFND